MDIKESKFQEFIVYSCDENQSFLHIDINDPLVFYKKLFNYFFDEFRLLQYIENKANVSFSPTPENYAALYKKLAIFIDKENDVHLEPKIEKEVFDAISAEYEVIEENGTYKVRLDKIGKIGEYIFTNLLWEYFRFECIIPKLNLLTDYNMSIFGIDTLFYSSAQKLLLLGESKVSKTIENGITLINKSLSTYQKQVDDEFTLILSQRWLRDKMGSFADDYGDITERSLSMIDFIKKANIEQIAIPIFIAHGGTKEPETILKQLQKIKKISLYGVKTIYFSISLPIINKEQLITIFTNAITERRNDYGTAI